MSQLRVEPTKNNSLTDKKQLPKVKKQLPNDKKTITEAKNNCRNVKGQLPNKQNSAAEELGSWKSTYCVRRAAQNNFRTIKKQLPNSKTQLQNFQKTNAKIWKKKCRKVKRQKFQLI